MYHVRFDLYVNLRNKFASSNIYCSNISITIHYSLQEIIQRYDQVLMHHIMPADCDFIKVKFLVCFKRPISKIRSISSLRLLLKNRTVTELDPHRLHVTWQTLQSHLKFFVLHMVSICSLHYIHCITITANPIHYSGY